MSKKSARHLKRVLAWTMATLMVLGVLPIGPYGFGHKVKAAGTTYQLSPETSIASIEKKGAIAEGTYGTEGYFTLSGTAIRGNSNTYSFELGKEKAGALEFTVTGKATVSVEFCSTGGSNESQMALLASDESGVIPDNANAVNQSVTGTTPATATYTDLESGTYKVVSPAEFTSRGVRITQITVVETSTDAAASVNFTPVITGLPEGYTVNFEKDGVVKASTAEAAVSLAEGTYSLTVSDGQGNKASDYRASVNDATTLKVQGGMENPEILVTASHVIVQVTLSEGSVLADNNSVSAVNQEDATDSVALIPGESASLKIDAAYDLKTSDGDTKATVNGKATVSVTSGMSALELAIEPTVVKPLVRLNDKTGAEGFTLTLTNQADAEDAHVYDAENGFGKLKIGATYALSLSGHANEQAAATVNGAATLIVTADLTAISVKVEVPVTEGLVTVDLTEGLKADQSYADGQITVGEDMNYKETDGSVQGSNNAKQLDNPGTNVNATSPVPGSGAYVKIVPTQNGRFLVEVKAKANATFFTDTTDGTTVVDNTVFGTGNKETKVFNVQAGHTYYLSAQGSKPTIYSMALDYRSQVSWSEVSSPELLTPVMDQKNGTITVPFLAEVGGISSDSLLVWMLDESGEIAQTVTTTENTEAGTVTFTPAASGTYTFKAFLQRANELDKESNEVTQAGFLLPMGQPVMNVPENQGNGKVRVTWASVPEASEYEVSLMNENQEVITTVNTTNPTYNFSNLTIGANYFVKVVASGNGYQSPVAMTQSFAVTAESKKSWDFAAFGQGATAMKQNGAPVDYETSNNAASGSVETAVNLKSTGTKGKLVPASTDGLAFYYTTIDPANENFTLSADVTVNTWTYTNGQEGFGLMAADRVGIDGDNSVFWNNSYMASVTKVEYLWDKNEQKVSDAGDKYSMKLGVGAQEKIGVTHANIADDSAVNVFSTNMYALDTSVAQADMGSGTYNRVGAYTNTNDLGDFNPVTTFHLEIQRNNTGYFITYTEGGKSVTKKFYHGDEGDELTKLDPNNIYVGFFASRSCDVTFSNINLTTIAPQEDVAAEVRPITYVTPSYTVESAKIANDENYDLVYYGNADGTLIILRGTEEIYNGSVKANTKLHVPVVLKAGDNSFMLYVTPEDTYQPSKYERLSSYDMATLRLTVNFAKSSKEIVYVSPDGSATAEGTYHSPMDIATALKYACAGQKIILKAGTYQLSSGLVAERGINGTAEKKITLMADPKAATRPVLDFGNQGSGLVIAGDYWYLQGFDVTRSTGKGVQISGNYNVADQLMTYRNGNTGLQISRYRGTDLWEDWPSNNLVLNCTSHNNADPGYEDADGFTAKLTVADGNVFDGCIAYYNADDGWDLFAKPETGAIGRVTIKNCIAYKNGYIQDPETLAEINAGNGNGFKMGGSSITGYHVLENSVAFANKAKGIDSNSCPDIQVKNSISFDNEGANVAFYTNDAKNTDFEATGILSVKTANTVGENIKPKGKQDLKKIYKDSNYYFNGSKSVNAVGQEASVDWFINTDTAAAIAGGISRNADGTINRGGYLELTDAAPANAGARMNGVASAIIEVPEVPQTNSQTTYQHGTQTEIASESNPKVTFLSSLDEIRTAAGVTGGDYVYVEVANLPGEDENIKLLNQAASQIKMAIGAYLRVDLYRMSPDGRRLNAITELQSPISFVLSIPAGLDGRLYDFGVIRIHNGKAQFLPDTDTDPTTITVSSDEYSAYAIVYTAKGTSAKLKSSFPISPKTDEEEGAYSAGQEADDLIGKLGRDDYSNGSAKHNDGTPVLDGKDKGTENTKLPAEETTVVVSAAKAPTVFPYQTLILLLILAGVLGAGAVILYVRRDNEER